MNSKKKIKSVNTKGRAKRKIKLQISNEQQKKYANANIK
jgi:hypothetical protein